MKWTIWALIIVLYYDTHTCNVTDVTDVMIIWLNNENKLCNMLCYRPVHIARDFL